MKTRIMVETIVTDGKTNVIYYPQHRFLFIWCIFREYFDNMPDPDTTSFRTLEQAQIFLDAVLKNHNAPKKKKPKSKYSYSFITYP